MVTVYATVPFASFRKSYARSFAETYPLPPPATVYGMLLSLVGERHRARHAGVRLALAFRRQPRIATALRKLSRYKYGVPSKQAKFGNSLDYIETLCGIELLCHVDSSQEPATRPRLEERVTRALERPETVTRTGVLCLGLSDDAIDDICLMDAPTGTWRCLRPSNGGDLELPVWVDHVGSKDTRWQRYELVEEQVYASPIPGDFLQIVEPGQQPFS